MGVAVQQKTHSDDEFPGENAGSVGADIRALRKSRSLTLVELADRLGRSVGFISQIERGISEPSINDLRNIAAVFNVPLSFLFGENLSDPAEAKHIVRASGRRHLGNAEGGLVEQLLSPDLSGSFEIVRSEFAPNSSLKKPIQRDTEEAGYIVSGTLDLEIDGRWHELEAGDSFRFAGEPYRWRNRSNQPAIAIWVIAPPTY